MLLTLGLTLSGLVLVLYLIIENYSYKYFKKRGLPFLEPSFPFGNFKRFIFGHVSIGETYRSFYMATPAVPAVGVFQVHRPVLMLKHPELIKQILVKDFASFQNRSFRMNYKLEPLFNHLVFAQGTKWRNLRAKLSPTFTSGKIKNMFDILKTKSNYLLNYLNNSISTEIEIKDLFARLLTDIIASCAFGIDCDSLGNPENEFRKWGKRSIEPSKKLLLGAFLCGTGKFGERIVKWNLLDSDITKYFTEMVKETIKFRETNHIVKSDFMQMLIQLKNNQRIEREEKEETFDEYHQDDGQSLSEEECAAQAFVFFVAGFETSSTTMSYAAYELASNPEVQDQLQKEIDFIWGKEKEINYEAIGEMVYLDQVIKG